MHFCARTAGDVESVEKQLAADFPSSKVYGATVDISKPDELSSWVSSCTGQSGRIDAVVANVSALAIPNTSENWHKTFNTDVMGTFHLIDLAMAHLEKTKGNIVAIASVSGRDIDFCAPSPYAAMKASVIHYIAQLAHTLAPKGVRANTVSPGNTYVADGFWAGAERDNPDLYNSQLKLNPMGRMARPEEIANAVVFLASEKASFISGQNLNVDGALCTGVQF